MLHSRQPGLRDAGHGPCSITPRLFCQQSVRGRRRVDARWRSEAARQDLWDYQGSSIQGMNLDTLKALHRVSYGHRGRLTTVVVVYDPQDPHCQQSEWEIERLASGLRHEPSLLIAKFNIRTAHLSPNSPARKDGPAATKQFLATVAEVTQLPMILMYPEGAPGVMKYNVSGPLTAENICSALNSCQTTVIPSRPPLRLTTAILPTTTTATTSGQQGQGTAVTSAVANPLLPRPGSYWTGQKVWFWTGILAASVALLAWERWLGPAWEAKALAKRQALRSEGKADDFDSDTNMDDIFRLRSIQGQQQQQGRSVSS